MLEKRLDSLVTLLNALHDLYRDYGGVLDAKLSAIRSADMPAVQELQMREQRLAERIAERSGLRRQLLEHIGGDLGLDKAAARGISLKALAARVPEPQRGHLLVMADKLRHVVEYVEQMNLKIGFISNVMLKHFEKVFEAMTGPAADPGVYTAQGRQASEAGEALFQAIG
jgi:flagellar biosynthesis/type III secretory pathway chaperone